MKFRKPLTPFPEIDRITMVAGQSLVMNDAEKFVQRVIKNEKAQVDKHHIESFGLFDSASPNFVGYYPNVTADDLEPKDSDYVYPIFRCLSEVIVRKSYDPIDFSKNGVLKASMQKLLGQTVYPNHEALVGNELGVVSKVFWEDSYTVDGIKIPAGINAEFKIDGKSHPNIARAVTSDPPAIHSNSVTVNFLWEPSHKKMGADEFRMKVGTFDDKGQLIRRIATEIVMYNETSFVPHGADPFAQRIKDGKINNPKYAQTRDSFTDKDGRERRFFAFSYKDNLAELSEGTILKNDNISNNENNKTKKNMNKGLILLFASLAGITIDSEMAKLSDEDFRAQFDYDTFEAEMEKNRAKLEALGQTEDEDESEEIANLKEEVNSLKNEKAELEKFKTPENEAKIKLSETVTAAKLAEVKRLYALTGKNDDTMLSKLEAASYDTLDLFEIQFKEQLEEKYPATCKDCGSQEISMGSASAEEEEKEPKTKTGKLNLIEAKQKLSRNKINLDFITGEK